MKRSRESEDTTRVGLDDPSCSLFIGGPAAGKRMHLPPDMREFYFPSTYDEHHRYRRETLATKKKSFSIYVWDRLMLEEAMALLIDGYTANGLDQPREE